MEVFNIGKYKLYELHKQFSWRRFCDAIQNEITCEQIEDEVLKRMWKDAKEILDDISDYLVLHKIDFNEIEKAASNK